MHSALDEVLHGKKSAKFIRETWEAEKAKFPKNTLHLRFTDNHDERRAIARFGEKGALAGQALAFTIDGIPLVYNGMEVGDTTESGFPALFEKMPIFWDIKVRRPEFPKFYDLMIEMRKNHSALRRGETIWQDSGNKNILSFIRKDENEEIAVAINMSSEPSSALLDDGRGRAKKRLYLAEITPDIYDKKEEKPKLDYPFSVPLMPWEFRIFRIVDGIDQPRTESRPVLKRRSNSN
jgi:glycosidase